jgi:hypothetical protein
MSSEVANGIMQAQAEMEAQRYNFDSTWQRIADLIDPDNALFLRQTPWQGERRDRQQFDSTGQLALERFSAAMESVLTPRTSQWHMLEPVDDSLRQNFRVMQWCEQMTRRLFRARYAPQANFVGASSEHYRSLGAYGNGCTFVDDIPGRTIRYRSEFIGHIWVSPDHTGLPAAVHRKFTLTTRQAIGMFGADALPRSITNQRPETMHEFLHCVKARMDYDPDRRDAKGKQFASYYVSCSHGDEVLEEGGYRTMPYIYSMYSTAPGETYGRGPASRILNTLNTINEQQKTMLRAGQLAVDPPLLMPEEDILESFSLRPGALNFGGVDSMGNARVRPFESGSNLGIGLEMVQDSRQVINDAFFVTLFQILVENPRMTATEALLRAQEKGELLGPPLGRQQTGYLSPLIERELDILFQIPGILDDMPPELAESGGLVDVKYTSPLNRLQRASESTGIMQTFEQLTPWAQVDPSVFKVFNPSRVAARLAEINGAPFDVLNSVEEMAAIKAQEDQQAQMGALLEAAPIAGKTALDLARAQQISGANPTAALLGGG